MPKTMSHIPRTDPKLDILLEKGDDISNLFSLQEHKMENIRFCFSISDLSC